jgi:hypothetical protein
MIDERNRRGNTQPKGVTGLAEFRTITDACECLILANNCPIPHKCRISFSKMKNFSSFIFF